MMRREFDEKDREHERKKKIKALFASEEEQVDLFGFTKKAFRFMKD